VRYKAVVALLLLSVFSSASCFGQLGMLKKKDKDQGQQVSDKAPQYSDSDKAKMAEIAQRPAVQDEIQKRWDVARNEDLRAAYAINQTANWGITDDPIKYYAKRGDDHLYGNPMMQVYINNIGQALVPKDSPNFYTFRILADPLPKAFSLTTGSIYISTGLLAMLDSEAQLSYVLGHEIAHVEQKHAFNRIRSEVLEEELNKEKEAHAERTKAIIGFAGAMGGGLIGGLAGGGGNAAAMGAMLGGGASMLAANLFVHSGVQQTSWTTIEENEADELGTKYMLSQGYDAREVPRLYASIDNMVGRDSRVGLGFIGEPRRVKERIAHLKELLDGPLHDQLAKLQKSSGLIGSGASFPVLLSAAKRDNGILAMQYDLFAMARQNLEDSLEQRSNDPAVHYYLSRVMMLTAKNPEDRRAAVAHIADGVRLDSSRGAIPELHLEYAISLLNQGNSANKDQVITELKTYVALYQRDNGGALPGNISAIFDYFNLEGESTWYLPPTWYPFTQLSNMGLPSTLTPDEVVRKATIVDAGRVAAVSDGTPAPKPEAPKPTKVSSPRSAKPSSQN